MAQTCAPHRDLPQEPLELYLYTDPSTADCNFAIADVRTAMSLFDPQSESEILPASQSTPCAIRVRFSTLRGLRRAEEELSDLVVRPGGLRIATSRAPPRDLSTLQTILQPIGIFSAEPAFLVSERLSGVQQANITHIENATGRRASVIVAGIPSDDLPASQQLCLTISSSNPEAQSTAIELSEDLLRTTCDSFIEFCTTRRKVLPSWIGYRRRTLVCNRGAQQFEEVKAVDICVRRASG